MFGVADTEIDWKAYMQEIEGYQQVRRVLCIDLLERKRNYFQCFFFLNQKKKKKKKRNPSYVEMALFISKY